PNYAVPFNNLGRALQAKSDLDGAIAAFREAIRLDPTFAWPRNGLGWALYSKGELDAAMPHYREAMRLEPKNTWPHNNLGFALRDLGELDEAIAEFGEAVRLEPKNAMIHNNLRQTERLRALLPRLPDVVAGRAEPASPVEASDFAVLCGRPFQKRYATAVRLYAKAFAAEPRLAADLAAGHRYDAACYAALAAAGKDADLIAVGVE